MDMKGILHVAAACALAVAGLAAGTLRAEAAPDMALGGFLWALWAVYKSNCGKSFGDYTLVMYRYAKDFRKI